MYMYNVCMLIILPIYSFNLAEECVSLVLLIQY